MSLCLEGLRRRIHRGWDWLHPRVSAPRSTTLISSHNSKGFQYGTACWSRGWLGRVGTGAESSTCATAAGGGTMRRIASNISPPIIATVRIALADVNANPAGAKTTSLLATTLHCRVACRATGNHQSLTGASATAKHSPLRTCVLGISFD